MQSLMSSICYLICRSVPKPTLAASGILILASPSTLAKWVLAISEGKFLLPDDIGMLSAVSLDPGAPKKKNPVEKVLAVNHGNWWGN